MKRLRKQIYCCLQTKLLDKIPDPRNGKEHYQSFIRKKQQHNTISVKQPEILIDQKLLKTQTLLI